MNVDCPKVSIMIPTYNQAGQIAETIQSALSQTFLNTEIIVSDDCSTDNTESVVREFVDNKKVIYYKNSVNIGRVANYRKTLYERVSGDYVINLDGDDMFVDNKFVTEAIELFANHDFKPLFLVACKRRRLAQGQLEDEFHKIDTSFKIVSGKDYVLNMIEKYRLTHLTTVYNRKAAVDCDFYREDIISSDTESLCRLALRGNVLLLNKVVGQWNFTGKNDSKEINIDNNIKNLVWVNNVGVELRKQVSLSTFILWRLRRKLDYSADLLRSLVLRKNKMRTVKLLLRANMMHVVILKAIFFFCRKTGSLFHSS